MFSLLLSFYLFFQKPFPTGNSLPVEKVLISSHFGTRKDPILKAMKFHSGIDFSAKIGSAVRSVAKGQVVYSGKHAGFGNLVVVRHSDYFTSHYAHLWGMRVKVGGLVQSGDLLGFIGQTGRTTGAHLHFEIRWNGEPINPMWVLEAQYAG